MNLICPHCSQTLSADGVPPETKVNCAFCKNDFLTPYITQPLLVGYPAQADNTKRENEVPEGLFRKLTSFRGRIGRLQYFYGLLLKLGLMFVAGLIVIMVYAIGLPESLTLMLALPPCLFVIWVNMSLQARRLHDMGQSGYWLLLYLVPIVNYLFALVVYIACLASEGNKKENRYGDRPYRIF
jgi:uncharacterized membrane protein YhaH (DUF805 family)